MTAETTLVLYIEDKKTIIAEVFAGENYYLPTNGVLVSIFEGGLDDFLVENPDYSNIEMTEL